MTMVANVGKNVLIPPVYICTRRYIDVSFVDLHKVKGMRGVYIASQLTAGRVGHRHIMTKITFDKGGMWQPVGAPDVDNYGNPLNCSLVGDTICLHHFH